MGVGTLWYRAEANLRKSRAAETSERNARLGAEARFSLALAAIKDYYSGNRDDVWLAEPDLDGSRRKLLQQAAEHYKKLQASLEDDSTPEAQSQLAAAYLELGCVTLQTKAKNWAADAASILDRAVAIRQGLAAAAPVDLDRQMSLAVTLSSRGLAERRAVLLKEADQSFGAAREILQRLSTQSACRERALKELAWTLGNIASIQLVRGKLDDRLPLHHHVLELREQLLREHPRTMSPTRWSTQAALLDLGMGV